LEYLVHPGTGVDIQGA